jgi:hypothetical protein
VAAGKAGRPTRSGRRLGAGPAGARVPVAGPRTAPSPTPSGWKLLLASIPLPTTCPSPGPSCRRSATAPGTDEPWRQRPPRSWTAPEARVVARNSKWRRGREGRQRVHEALPLGLHLAGKDRTLPECVARPIWSVGASARDRTGSGRPPFRGLGGRIRPRSAAPLLAVTLIDSGRKSCYRSFPRAAARGEPKGRNPPVTRSSSWRRAR